MEAPLGHLTVPHDPALELYDYIQIKDKRGSDTYTNYPTDKWNVTNGKLCIVGSLVHIYEAGVRDDLEINFNGINSNVTDLMPTKRSKVPGVTDEGAEAIGGWGFIGGVGGGGPLPGQQTAQPFAPILDPAQWGGKPAAWNVAIDLFTGGNQVRRDITNQAILWAQDTVLKNQQAANTEYMKQIQAGQGFSLTPEQQARLGGAGTTPKPRGVTPIEGMTDEEFNLFYGVGD
jgi:hypothetical protein